MTEKEKALEIFEHDANGSTITVGLAEHVKGKLAEKELRATTLRMAKSQWEKIVRIFNEVDGKKFNDLEFATIKVVLDRAVPEHEIRFCAKDGTVIAKIVGLER